MAVAEALIKRRAPVLAAVDEGYLVYRRRPLSEMSDEQKLRICEAYNQTGFVAENCYTFEVFGFYTDLSTAIEEAESKHGSWMEVTVNHSLPNELGRYKPGGNPGSPSDEFFQRTNPGLLQTNGVDRAEAERLNRDLKEHVRELSAIVS